MTSNALQRLVDTVLKDTQAYRKGAEVEEKDVNGVHVMEVFGYPETPSHGELVDVHFINIGFTENVAGLTKEVFLDMIKEAEEGEFANMPLSRLKEGPSYIELGGWLGSQDIALRFLALGSHLGLWDVVTPERLGMTGELADQMAGGGFVMNAGVKE